jgi:dethiobiotin synthetase
MHKSIAIIGIHTGIGKTVVSAVIAEAIGADYWKPVQAGIEERDMSLVQELLTNGGARVHREAVLLTQPVSPHAAAEYDGVTIDFREFKWPETDKVLLVETAGGLMSPISAEETMIDFIQYYDLPVVLVTNNYLGSINHTLLTLEVLHDGGVQVLGIVVSGDENRQSESFIENYSNVPIIAHVPQLINLDAESVHIVAKSLQDSFKSLMNYERHNG